MKTRQLGMKDNGGFSVERHVDPPDRVIAVEVPIHARQSHIFFFVVEIDADDSFGVLEIIFLHARSRG